MFVSTTQSNNIKCSPFSTPPINLLCLSALHVHLHHTICPYPGLILNTQHIHTICLEPRIIRSMWCVHLEHAVYSFLLLAGNTWHVYTMCSTWTHSQSIPCVQLEHPVYVYNSFYLEHTSYLYHVFNLNTQPIFITYSPSNTQYIHIMCSLCTHTHSLFITCFQFEHANIHTCLPCTHSISIFCPPLIPQFFHIRCLLWIHSLSIPCVHSEHPIHPCYVFTEHTTFIRLLYSP